MSKLIATEQAIEICHSYREAKQIIKTNEQNCESWKKQLFHDYFSKGEELWSASQTIIIATAKMQERTFINQKKLEEEFPEAFQACAYKSIVQPLVIK